MQHESFIAGKDASLESSIQSMQDKLTDLGFHIEERSWLNPVANAWSVHIRDCNCPLLFTNGKGATELAARASALGEFFERLGCNYFWSHYYLGETLAAREFVHYPQERWFPLPKRGHAWPKGLLDAELRAFYNPDGSVPASALVDRNSGNAARGICALPYQRVRDGETLWFPVNLIGNLYVSNGMSAGNTVAEARVQALSEIFERHVKFRIIGEGICLPDVPEEVIARYPKIEAGIRDLRAAGFGILVKDASLGGLYPVMNVTLLNPHDQGCFSSFGAHPRFEVALERALTELLQGRALDALGDFPEPGFDLDEIADAPNLEIHFVDSSGIISWEFLRGSPDFAFVDWDEGSAVGKTTETEFAGLCEAIHAEGRDIYIADFPHLGVYACRILVPSMSEIYPIDDLEWNNNSVGNQLHPSLLNLPHLDDAQLRELLGQLDELGLDEQRPVPALIGLAEDAWSLWHDLRVGELKLLIALAIRDTEAIREGCEWVRQFEQLDEERRLVYRCVETLMQMPDPEAYRDSLLSLFGAYTLNTAQAMLRGEERFFGLEAPGMDLAGCVTHMRLLEAYRKLVF